MWHIKRFECARKTIGLYFHKDGSEFFEFGADGKASLGKLPLPQMVDFLFVQDSILLDMDFVHPDRSSNIWGSKLRFRAMNWPDGRDGFHRVDSNSFSVWSPARQCCVIAPRSPAFSFPSDVECVSVWDTQRALIECGGKSVVMEWFPKD